MGSKSSDVAARQTMRSETIRTKWQVLQPNLTKCFHGRMGSVARFSGRELMASHREPSVIEKNFGSKGFCCMEQLMHVVKFGAPMDVGEGDDVHAALSYGKHQALTFGDRWSCLLYTSPSPRDRG